MDLLLILTYTAICIAVFKIFRIDVGVQIVQYLGGDVVIQRRGRIRKQQPGARRRGPHDHEELVVDVEKAENCSGAA